LLTAVVPAGAGPRPTYLAAHRWRYARVPRSDRTCAWNAALQLGACGDWLLGPRVEQAWLSGIALARTIGYQQPVGAP
jgi:predicted NAD/FAD-dependent oxidoreductase